MAHNRSNAAAALGFLTVVSSETNGYFGGYLILDASGRPHEFHCTAPVKPNRAQEILYGATLQEYLFAEQIGPALVKQSKKDVPLLCTDVPQMVGVRSFVDRPVALVIGDEDKSGTRRRIDSAHTRRLPSFQHHHRRLAVAPDFDDDVAEVTRCLDVLGDAFDLLEPFARIQEAIKEAQAGQ